MRLSKVLVAFGRTGKGTPARTSRPAKRAGPGGWLFRHRNTLGVALATFLLLFPWGRTEPSVWWLASGLGLTLAGSALRLWAICQIGGAARKTSRLTAQRVISWGPFAMVRNPIYIANITVFAGFTVLSRLLWALPLVVVTLGLWYHALIRREEAFLEESFGDAFVAYRRTTRRWLPSLRFGRRPADAPGYPVLRALRRERGHLLIVAAGILWFLFLPSFCENMVHRFANSSSAGSGTVHAAAHR